MSSLKRSVTEAMSSRTHVYMTARNLCLIYRVNFSHGSRSQSQAISMIRFSIVICRHLKEKKKYKVELERT
jgi:hypothetical protein